MIIKPQPGETGFDIEALVKSFEGKPQHARVANILKRASQAKSCASDLYQASECLEILNRLFNPPSDNDITSSTIHSSLQTTAVLLYCRATSDGGVKGSRPGIDISKKLTVEQKAAHATIVRLRNRAIAHVHKGETYERAVWHDSKIVGIAEGDSLYFAGLSKTVGFQRELILALGEQIGVAEEIIRAVFHAALDDLGSVLSELGWIQQARQFPISISDYLGSREAAQQAWRARAEGRASGVMRWAPIPE